MAKAWNILGQQSSGTVLYEGAALWCLGAFAVLTYLLKDNASVKKKPKRSRYGCTDSQYSVYLAFFLST